MGFSERIDTILNWTEPNLGRAGLTAKRAKQPWLQAACVSEGPMCWGAWDNTCGHKAKDITHQSPGGERGVGKSSIARLSSLKGRERSIVSQANIETISYNRHSRKKCVQYVCWLINNECTSYITMFWAYWKHPTVVIKLSVERCWLHVCNGQLCLQCKSVKVFFFFFFFSVQRLCNQSCHLCQDPCGAASRRWNTICVGKKCMGPA